MALNRFQHGQGAVQFPDSSAPVSVEKTNVHLFPLSNFRPFAPSLSPSNRKPSWLRLLERNNRLHQAQVLGERTFTGFGIGVGLTWAL